MTWSTAPSSPEASQDVVDVWRVSTASVAAGAPAALSPAEGDRAARFRRPGDRRRFVAARASLKAILSRYLSAPAESIELARGPGGKPVLREGGPRFNLSHSAEVALVAVSRREVGVDVERITDRVDPLVVAPMVLNEGRVEDLRRMAAGDRLVAFHRDWVALEARLKCDGAGLAGARAVGAELEMRGLPVGRGYTGAVAARGSGWSLRLWDFEP